MQSVTLPLFCSLVISPPTHALEGTLLVIALFFHSTISTTHLQFSSFIVASHMVASTMNEMFESMGLGFRVLITKWSFVHFFVAICNVLFSLRFCVRALLCFEIGHSFVCHFSFSVSPPFVVFFSLTMFCGSKRRSGIIVC
jgi:hypothetical protein